MLRLRSNWSVILVEPSELTEVIEVSPSIVENCLSRGVATEEAIVSGLAPGRLAVTKRVGKSTFGRSLTGSNLYPITPKRRIPNIISVVATGLRMNTSDIFIGYFLGS
jgi:hypothetical protein